MTTQKLYDKFHYFSIPPNGNPIEALHALENRNNQMAEKEMGVPNTFLHARFVRALPDEYGHVKATLQQMKNRDRPEIIRMIGTRYSTLPQKKGLKPSSRPPEQAFFSNESGGRRDARRDRGCRRRGTQGCGRGGNSNKGGGSSCGGGSSSASSPRRWWQTSWPLLAMHQEGPHQRGVHHEGGSDFLAKCARCSGFGHEESTCSSDAAVQAMELPMSEEDLAMEAQAFIAKETGKCRVAVGEEVGGGELGKQVMQYIADSAAT